MYKVCKKCKKLYWRNVTKCLKCNQEGTLDLIIPQRFKVLASTTVNIPSKEHQKVPYNILAQKDEYGNTSIRKTFKYYKTGAVIKDKQVNTNDYLICTKVRYIENAAIERLFTFIEELLKYSRLFIDINLSDCKPKPDFEAGKMLSKKTIEHLLSLLRKSKTKYGILDNDYSQIIKIKYNLAPDNKNKDKKCRHLKVISINSINSIKQDTNTIYFIDAKYMIKNSHIYKANLLFLTNNIKLLKDFFSSGKIDDNLFYGEEAEIIYEELKNYE